MSSTRSPTAMILLLLSLLTHHLALATPLSSPPNDQNNHEARSPNKHTRSAPDLSCLTLPTNPNAASPLPAPPSHLKLKHVALGVGTQNYTCAVPGSSSTKPSSAGALASLYDIGPFLASPLGRLFENALPPLALAMYGALDSAEHGAAWNALVAQMPSALQEQKQQQGAADENGGGGGGLSLSTVAFGEHFFAEVEASLTPTWDLLPNAAMYPDEPQRIMWQGKKDASADAPRTACKGLKGEGAVPWLYLSETASSSDGGGDGDGDSDGDIIEGVYRVITAGGMQPETCEGVEEEEIEVKYAAEYWFYGR